MGFPAFYVKRSDGGFVPPPDGLSGLQQRSLNAMLPLIKAELSLINSVLELKDFRSLPDTIRRIANLPKLLASAGRKGAGSLNDFRKSLREWFRTGADSYLQAQFNIVPLLSDIAGIAHALSRTERRINDFITRSGSTQHRHYDVIVQEQPLSSHDTNTWSFLAQQPGEYEIASGGTIDRFVTSEATSFHAEIEYNYNYTRYQVEHARLFALLDAVGVNFNPAIIWNAIPWSFVVDWVFYVSNWLATQRIGLMDPKINIHRYLWSVKRARTFLIQRRSTVSVYGDRPGTNTSPTVPMPVVSERAYRRTVELPSPSSIQSSGLNPKEFTLAAALVIARRGKRKVRSSWGSISGFSP